jgi:hypothetical protein
MATAFSKFIRMACIPGGKVATIYTAGESPAVVMMIFHELFIKNPSGNFQPAVESRGLVEVGYIRYNLRR